MSFVTEYFIPDLDPAMAFKSSGSGSYSFRYRVLFKANFEIQYLKKKDQPTDITTVLKEQSTELFCSVKVYKERKNI